jgi:hypothetical protein
LRATIMEALSTNPFGLLTFIVAPAILTNASSVLSLGTANRFARAIDRARALSSMLEGGEGKAPTPLAAFRARQLRFAERRALLLVRALTAFYVSVGAFGAASLVSLLGAIVTSMLPAAMRYSVFGLALGAGVLGVAGLVTGSALLVIETRMALRILGEETDLLVRRLPVDPQG